MASPNPSVSCDKLLTDFEGVRRFLLDKLEDVSEKEARTLVPGAKVHLHWHVGHLIYVQSSVLLIRAGDPSPVPKSFRAYFGNGTSAASHDSLAPDWDELMGRAREFSRDLAAKHGPRAGKALKKPFKLMNIQVRTVGEAVPFLLAHEGEHVGQVKRILAQLAA